MCFKCHVHILLKVLVFMQVSIVFGNDSGSLSPPFMISTENAVTYIYCYLAHGFPSSLLFFFTAFVLSTNCQDGPTEEVYVQVNLTYAISTNQSAAENDADCDGMPAATTMASSTVQAVDLTTLTDNALSSLVFDILLACPGVGMYDSCCMSAKAEHCIVGP